MDRGGERFDIDTGNDAKKTFELTGQASEPAGKDAPKRTAKGSRIPG
jgi:hypothetical protein